MYFNNICCNNRINASVNMKNVLSTMVRYIIHGLFGKRISMKIFCL